MNNTGIIILAAGSSSRFGGIKQLLKFNNKTLVQHVIDEAIGANAAAVIVVTGANSEEVSKEIIRGHAHIVFNEQWKDGMASGIVAGVRKAVAINDAIEKIIITVCDQPFVTSALFTQLYETQMEGVQHMVACRYADTVGTPALFTQKYFGDLLNLEGDEGAKRILKMYAGDVATIDFPLGEIDIDTQEDYKRLLHEHKHVS